MISKFSIIKNAGVFNDFTWKKGGDCAGLKDFSTMNVLYGRNYSGKTTLSRIVQSFETKALPSHMENMEFSLECSDGKFLTQNDIDTSDLTVRVYNSDFIAKNIQFSQTPTSESFAVLGQTNIEVQSQIDAIESELGSSETDKETGLHLRLKYLTKELSTTKENYEKKFHKLENALIDKARTIKSNEIYGKLTKSYNITRLREDITKISELKLSPLNEEEKVRLKAISREQERAKLSSLYSPLQNLTEIVDECNKLCSRKIGTSKQIAELATNYALAKWVQEGMALHTNKNHCAFCGQPLPDKRWEELKACFNHESAGLSSEIKKKKMDLENLVIQIQALYENPGISHTDFYSDYSADASVKILAYKDELKKLIASLETLIKNLTKREQTINIECPFDSTGSVFNVNLESVIGDLNSLIAQNNSYTDSLASKINSARQKLLNDEVLEFINLSGYFENKAELETLHTTVDSLSDELTSLSNEIRNKQETIRGLERRKQDMTRGVDIINGLLTKAMPNTPLRMDAVQDPFDTTIRFAIKRNEKPAYNLSDGERSLIGLCYFSASLESVDSINRKLIIWIDDPISSLDDNNIFACYAIIADMRAKLKKSNNLKQMFISTHRLNFFKYISRWGLEQAQKYYICRKNNSSSIMPLPHFIETTYFGLPLWFKTIYTCANEELSEDNIGAYSTFGNDARKFFEFENAFKYPNKDLFHGMLEFWGDENAIPRMIVVKLDNEFSHVMSTPLEYDIIAQSFEIHDTAIRIIERLKQVDETQFNSLVAAVSASPDI